MHSNCTFLQRIKDWGWGGGRGDLGLGQHPLQPPDAQGLGGQSGSNFNFQIFVQQEKTFAPTAQKGKFSFVFSNRDPAENFPFVIS